MTIKEGIAYDINTAPEHIDLKAEDMMATFNIGKTALWRWVKQKILPPPYESQNLGFRSCRRRRKTVDLLVAQANPGHSRG